VFATLLGAMPDPPGIDGPGRLAAVVAAQEAAGLEPLTDGQAARDPGAGVVAAWRAAALLTGHAVKQPLTGPWSTALRASRGGLPAERVVLGLAESLHETVLQLAAAGCPLIEIEETEAHRIGTDPRARRVFREAHLRLARDAGTHLTLSIVGGSAWEAGPTTILDAPYHSLAVDLIAGPDNWRLVALTPGDRGIVAGALSAVAGRDEGPELLVWAAHYAASTGGRGLERVGLGTAGSLGHLPWDEALAKLRALGEAARIAALPQGELADAIDPRAVSIRAGATGQTRQERQPGRERPPGV
jgi:methionine synthase II (cobalamin-independent)